MSKDDLCGFIGALLCATVGWFDPDWRAFWYGAGIVLGVWTMWSLSRTNTK